MNILMVASECRGWAKVGGLADVLKDLATALADQGHRVCVLLPYYDVITEKARRLDRLEVRFGGALQPVEVFGAQTGNLSYRLLKASFFSGDLGTVYVDSQKRHLGPFEDDAARFAFFSAAALEFLDWTRNQNWEIVHCHDWHTGLIPLLMTLQKEKFPQKVIFTIHNLEYQGIRPWQGRLHSLAGFSNWFPGLFEELNTHEIKEKILDRRFEDCFNPLRAGIQFADQITTVSPTYAQEITQPDNLALGFFGGRGLEKDLALAQRNNRLTGILNGIDYEEWARKSLTFRTKVDLFAGWPGAVAESAAKLGQRFSNAAAAVAHAADFARRPVALPLVVMVTRAVEQKLGILFEPWQGRSVLDHLLDRPLNLLVIGTGDWAEKLEWLNDRANAMFLSAFEPGLGDSLFSCGDLFLMPSDFEPCGLSQMIAMSYGNLPLVHDRGGLHDTVHDNHTGFSFSGHSRQELAHNFLRRLDEALALFQEQPMAWQRLRDQARQQRYDWSAGLIRYLDVYRRSGRTERP